MKFSAVKTLVFLIIGFSLYACNSAHTTHILAIGDSNGAHPNNWVKQLKALRPEDSIMNVSISGNTIGFDNLGRDTLNTLANIQEYLLHAQDSLQTIDEVIILLGTNDCKAIYDSLQEQVVANMNQLMTKIQAFSYQQPSPPEIMLVSPPPMSEDSLLQAKYTGGRQCVENLLPNYQRIAEAHQSKFIDIYHPLLEAYDSLTVDGVHLNDEGYMRMAKLINQGM